MSAVHRRATFLVLLSVVAGCGPRPLPDVVDLAMYYPTPVDTVNLPGGGRAYLHPFLGLSGVDSTTLATGFRVALVRADGPYPGYFQAGVNFIFWEKVAGAWRVQHKTPDGKVIWQSQASLEIHQDPHPQPTFRGAFVESDDSDREGGRGDPDPRAMRFVLNGTWLECKWGCCCGSTDRTACRALY